MLVASWSQDGFHSSGHHIQDGKNMQGVFFYSFFVCCAINYHKLSGFKHSDGHTPLQIAWKNVPLALLPQQ